MSKQEPRPSRCTTGLRISSMSGVTCSLLSPPQHFTIWTLHHDEALLASAGTWPEILSAAIEWTAVEA